MPDESTYEAWDLEALSDIPNYQKWIVSVFRPYLHGEAAEIGAGSGTFSRRLIDHVSRLQLVEPAANLVAELKNEFAEHPDIEITSETAEEYLASEPPASRDCVVLVNVLEHIEDDAGAMAGLSRLLRPGGHLLIFVPALPMLFSAMDVALQHHRRYRRGELVGLVRRAGLEVITSRYFDFIGIVPWWLAYTIGGKTRFDPRLSRLYDRIAVPVGRAMEAVVPPPLGKNIVLVARRPRTPDAPGKEKS